VATAEAVERGKRSPEVRAFRANRNCGVACREARLDGKAGRGSIPPIREAGVLQSVRVLAESSEDEMVASFLHGELSSERFGPAVRHQLAVMGEPEELLTRPDLTDPQANRARHNVLAATRGYACYVEFHVIATRTPAS
jgi:hypothetical protein